PSCGQSIEAPAAHSQPCLGQTTTASTAIISTSTSRDAGTEGCASSSVSDFSTLPSRARLPIVTARSLREVSCGSGRYPRRGVGGAAAGSDGRPPRVHRAHPHALRDPRRLSAAGIAGGARLPDRDRRALAPWLGGARALRTGRGPLLAARSAPRP